MRAVWSLWTRPFRSRQAWSWLSERHHLLSWILSVETARRHYPDTALVTDDEGAALLVDGLGLRFSEVSTELNNLAAEDADWWILGKLHAYRVQRRPFVHIDADVYLWNPLPERLVVAPVCAQNPEEAGSGVSWYDLGECEYVIREMGDGWLPLEWTRYRERGSAQMAACCGILGGTHLDFLRQYAGLAIELLENPANRAAFRARGDRARHNPVFEQYLLSACADYHGVPIEYLFDSFGQAVAPGQAAAAGFTHLIAGSKSNPALVSRLEQRVAREYPQYFARCEELAPPVVG